MAMDLFLRARLKITLLYFLLGLIILGVAGYFIYSDLTTIVRNLLQVIQGLLAMRIVIDQNTAAAVIAKAINTQIEQMDLSVGIWLIIAMVLAAYLLAGFTLRPVKRAMERQKRFMANVSHELRTPLSVMKANTEATLLGANQLTQEELKQAVSSNLEEIDRMAKILEFLLNFSNIENRLTRLSFSNVDVVDATKKAVGLMKRLSEEKQVTLTIAGPASATVAGNATAIEEMVLNLLKNAIAYTPPGGSVTATVTKKFGTTAISVADTGAGIPAKDIPNIFEAFYRGENAVKIKKDGSVGLGLAIVNEIASFHGATIGVESEQGKGTTIHVSFPNRFSRWFSL